MDLIAALTASFAADLLVSGTGCLMIFVLGIALVRATVFVSGLVIFFANTTTRPLVASIDSDAAHFMSVSTASI